MAIFNISKDDLRFFAKKLPLAVSTAKVANAVSWFQDKAEKLTTVTGETNAVARPKPGHIYMYRYDAKWDKYLPTWDKQPLMLVLNLYNNRIPRLKFPLFTSACETQINGSTH